MLVFNKLANKKPSVSVRQSRGQTSPTLKSSNTLKGKRDLHQIKFRASEKINSSLVPFGQAAIKFFLP